METHSLKLCLTLHSITCTHTMNGTVKIKFHKYMVTMIFNTLLIKGETATTQSIMLQGINIFICKSDKIKKYNIFKTWRP